MLRHGLVGIVLGGTLTITTPSIAQPKFDHDYSTYALILSQFVVDDRVDYRRLADNRDSLDTVVEELSAVSRLTFNAWSREKRLAYWINVYNLFTLRTIVDHYPIKEVGSAFILVTAFNRSMARGTLLRGRQVGKQLLWTKLNTTSFVRPSMNHFYTSLSIAPR